MDERIKYFGLAIRQTRKSNGFSQEKLAEITGLHRTYIGAIERGERNVSINNILRLADALKVPPRIFFENLG